MSSTKKSLSKNDKVVIGIKTKLNKEFALLMQTRFYPFFSFETIFQKICSNFYINLNEATLNHKSPFQFKYIIWKIVTIKIEMFFKYASSLRNIFNIHLVQDNSLKHVKIRTILFYSTLGLLI